MPGAVAELQALERVGTVAAWSATDQLVFDAAFDYGPFLRAKRQNRLYTDDTVRALILSLIHI